MNELMRTLFGMARRQIPSKSAEEWHTHWKQQGQAWRTEPPIDAARQKELSQRRAIVPDIKRGIYPFKGMQLSRADIEWLLATHANGQGPLDWSDKSQRTHKGLDIRGAHLSQVDLHNLPLAGLRGGLDKDEWRKATFEQRSMAEVYLERSNLSATHLEGSCLTRAHLENANLSYTHLEGADLYRARLEGAYLEATYLGGTSLRNAFFDTTTHLSDVIFADKELGTFLVADVHWSDVNLSLVDWKRIKALGDENWIRQSPARWGRKAKERSRRLRHILRAVRANRQLAVALQNQGLNEDAARFAYHAQTLQRKGLWTQREFGRWFFSMLLAVLAGYGYRMWRILAAYLLVVSACAVAYFVLGSYFGPPLSLLQAFFESITAFHGRVFAEVFQPDSPQMWVTAFEAVAGLLIEGVFIAMLTQRFFGK